MVQHRLPEDALWAQYYTVGPKGLYDTDGQPVDQPTAAAASALAAEEDQLQHIGWVNFSLFVDNTDKDSYRIGESIIATSHRRIQQVVFRPVSEVIESGRLTRYSAEWLGYLASGNHELVPDRFEELVGLLDSVPVLAR